MNAFSPEDDFVTKARADHHFQAGPGSLVQLTDGRVATIVYNNLDGYGIVYGDRPDLINNDDELPEPEAMLREPYATCEYPCVGELVRILRRVKPDGTVREYMTTKDAGGIE